MTYDPTRHHRRSLRLPGYDYTQGGAYFITVVSQDRTCLFGEVVDGVMCSNDAGRMVQTVWNELPAFYPGVDIDRFAVMPNHIHGIVVLVDRRADDDSVGHPGESYAGDSSIDYGHQRNMEQALGSTSIRLSLADVVQRFKMMTTKRYADGVRGSRWPAYRGRLWQRNYYEHVIRDESSLTRVRRYVDENPLRWEYDGENPVRTIR
jgi:putative transposase